MIVRPADLSGICHDHDVNSATSWVLIQSGILRGRREQSGCRFQKAFSSAAHAEENRADDPCRCLRYLRRPGISRPKDIATRHTSRSFDGRKLPYTARLGMRPDIRNACFSLELGTVL